MSDRLQAAFNLSRHPFDKDLSVDQRWLNDDRLRALELIQSAVTHRQHALAVGEPGVGKTFIQRLLKQNLSPVDFRVEYVAHVTLGPRDFYRQLCYAFGTQPKATPAAMFESLQRECATSAIEHRLHTIIVIDEAHLMPDSTLGHLHLLANFNWDRDPFLSLVLVGLPELLDRLRHGIHRSLLTRIHTKVELPPASPEATASYVRQRLADAGAKNEIFTADGLASLHELTGGLLRSIDILAVAALRRAADEDLRLVDRPLVRKALHDTPLL